MAAYQGDRAPSTTAEARNQRAVIHVSPQTLQNLLDLPGDMRVVWVHGVNDPTGVAIVVESEVLEPQPTGAHLPTLEGSWATESRWIDDRPWYRWAWSRDPHAVHKDGDDRP